MELILFGLAALAIVVIANLVEASQRPIVARAFDWLLLAGHIPTFLLGVALWLLRSLPPAFTAEAPGGFVDIASIGILLAMASLWAMLVSIRRVREWLARWLPLRSDSAVNTLALVFSGYLLAGVLFTLLQPDLATLSEADLAVSVYDVVLQQLLFALLALVGAGLFIRRSNEELNERLGLVRPTLSQLLHGTRWIPVLIIMQWVVGGAWAWLNPEQAELMGDMNEVMLGDFDTLWEWFVLALSSGLGEELLFRGALQPVLGLPVTTFLFAVAHVQFGFTPLVLAILIAGWVLGRIRQRTNTIVAIYVHFGYNMVLGLLALLASLV